MTEDFAAAHKRLVEEARVELARLEAAREEDNRDKQDKQAAKDKDAPP